MSEIEFALSSKGLMWSEDSSTLPEYLDPITECYFLGSTVELSSQFASTQFVSHETFFQLALCLTRAKYQNRFCITNTRNDRIVVNVEKPRRPSLATIILLLGILYRIRIMNEQNYPAVRDKVVGSKGVKGMQTTTNT